ncbi:DNA polymerase III subunit epsilon [Sphingobium algorifonticola]|uniref:DNA polymerase III subunit epsilon n=1 Tax=Sphingobium algorifonticola TaxID=2008318 RepID=A0A437JD54_9SPHN|nr:DNA polymerase III subunit epsilon [Sphingobium algorifonticola]RVT43849.1 DNA polymerase III subunit epsilon [Sphingobium algorifonticola]
MREIIFDTETTGFDPATGDRLVEIGCIELINRVPTGQTFHAYFNPQRAMPAAAEAVHGLSDIFLSDKPLFRDGVDALLAFLGDSPLVAHNAKFDFGFLNHELKLIARDPISFDRMIDTVAIARSLHPGAKHSLDALCTRYGIDRSHRVKHGALLDAELLAQLYIELTGGRQIGLTLAQEAGDAPASKERGPVPTVRPLRAARPHRASIEELERHKAFVATLEKPLWLAGPAA